MEAIQMRFNYEIRYDLQHVLFTDNLRAFFNSGARRTTGIEFRRSNDSIMNQQDQPSNHQASESTINNENAEILRDMMEAKTSQPLGVLFPKEDQ